jgi:hypothetical protein
MRARFSEFREKALPAVIDFIRRSFWPNKQIVSEAEEIAEESILKAAGNEFEETGTVGKKQRWLSRAVAAGSSETGIETAGKTALACKSAHDLGIDRIRKQGKCKTNCSEAHLDAASDNVAIAVRDLEIDCVDAVKKLPKKERQAVELRFFKGYTIDETANLMQLTTAQVKTLWGNARSTLSQVLKSYDIESE